MGIESLTDACGAIFGRILVDCLQAFLVFAKNVENKKISTKIVTELITPNKELARSESSKSSNNDKKQL
jgi:hypothetical protein